jgi:hypothetical protein
MATLRYALHPGWITSRTDGDRHFITAGQLAALYGVPVRKCLIIPDESTSQWGSRKQDRDRLVRYAGELKLIALAPRHDGDYSLPTT